MLYSYYLGLDPGQARDYTALSLVEEPVWVREHFRGRWQAKSPGWASPASMRPEHVEEALSDNYHNGRPHGPPLSVRHLERFELGTRYPVVTERVKELLTSEPLRFRRVALLVDKTGVGAPVVDAFVQANL